MDEVSKAIDQLPSGKAPGSNCILAEVLKSEEAALLQPLYELLCICWQHGHIPQDMRDANILTLYIKQKKPQ